MIALIDLDSLIYKAMYGVVSIEDMRKKLSEIDHSKNTKPQKAAIRDWIVEQGFDRMEKQTAQIIEDSMQYGIEITKVEFFITYCLRSIRKSIDPMYKNNRKGSGYREWCNRLRSYVAEKSELDVKYNLLWEADDLIYNRAKELRKNGNTDYVVYSIDKDLLQIEGTHFNYYREKVKGKYVECIPDIVYLANRTEYSRKYFVERKDGLAYFYEFHMDYKGITTVNRNEGYNFLLKQLIKGDSIDNIKGLKGKGDAYISKNFTDSPWHNAKVVIREYRVHYGYKWKTELKKAYRLLKIGI